MSFFSLSNFPYKRLSAALLLIFSALSLQIFSQIASEHGADTIVIEDAPAMEVIAYGKNVVVRQRAKGVLAFGGNVVIEGDVTGDVAAVGGSVTQRESGYIGGDVIVLGGTYTAESADPKREPGHDTVMYAGYEEELRDLLLNPSQMLAPAWSLNFAASRILSTVLWFIATLVFAFALPKPAARAISSFRLSALKMTALGIGVFGAATVLILAVTAFLPGAFGAIFGLVMLIGSMLAYIYGRVTLQAATGKVLAKYLRLGNSESIAILSGTVLWAAVLTIPYVWPFAVIFLISAGTGVLITALPRRSR